MKGSFPKFALLFILASLSIPSYAKSAWFICGSQRIYLNETKNEYVVEDGDMSYKGNASFFPSSVKFELVWREWSPNQYGIKYGWNIDRKTLRYIRTMEINQDTKGFVTNRGWIKKTDENGLCKMISDPYKNKKF